MTRKRLMIAGAALAILVGAAAGGSVAAFGGEKSDWQQEFDLADRTLLPTGRNTYFVLEPGFRVVLASPDVRLVITVLDETVEVDGVTTRVVEERTSKNDRLAEVSRNFYAIDKSSKDIFYFGEEVVDYEGGDAVSGDGGWLAGTNGARAGLIMPGTPKVGMRYFQQLAPGVAMDRVEIVSLEGALATTAGSASSLLTTREESALDTDERELKIYASGIGLVREEQLVLSGGGASPL